ncbi:hypothetical protein ABIA31_009247 [Catenulispora sp. MAP5-51]|uniref:hypothetical protein n=1 Tax=Catenulispora sp. MAP5-51 TaxID=3156298 RepID=UPI003516DA68
MAFHCGAPTRDGSACQRHVRELGTRCSQHRNLGGPALRPPRHAMRIIELADPALITAQSVWPATRPAEPRDRVTPPPSQESQPAETGTLADEEPMFYDAEPEDTADDDMADDIAADPADADAVPTTPTTPTTPVWLQWAAEGRERAVMDAERDAERDGGPVGRAPGHGAVSEPAGEELPVVAGDPVAEPEPKHEAETEAEQGHPRVNGHAVKAEEDPEPHIDQRPMLRKERALDPDWIGGRPLFRDEAPTRPMPRIEFEPSDAALPRRTPVRPPRIAAAMRSVVLNPQPAKPAEPAAEPDPPTLIDRMPPIDPDDLAVPDFLRPDFVPTEPDQRPEPPPPANRTPTSGRTPITDFLRAPGRSRGHKPQPAPLTETPTAGRSLPTDHRQPTDSSLIAERPLTADRPPLPIRRRSPNPAAAPAPAPRSAAAPSPVPAPKPAPEPDPPTLVDLSPVPPPEDISVPDFMVPGFARPAPEPPLRTVLSTVLGPDLWQRCYTEWGPAHCTALARIARAVDGLAPSASAAMRSTAGAGMRWLGVAREREMLADLVAEAISHPAGATAANQARTVRLYGAAICVALNVPLRRCACHRDLERDVSGELIRLGLEELAGEVP